MGYYRYNTINNRLNDIEKQIMHFGNSRGGENNLSSEKNNASFVAQQNEQTMQQQPIQNINSVMEKNYLMQNPQDASLLDSQIRKDYDSFLKNQPDSSQCVEENTNEILNDETDEDESDVEEESCEENSCEEECDEDRETDDDDVDNDIDNDIDNDDAKTNEAVDNNVSENAETNVHADMNTNADADETTEIKLENIVVDVPVVVNDLEEIALSDLEEDDISIDIGLSENDKKNIDDMNDVSTDYETKYKTMTVKELKEEFKTLYSSDPKNKFKKNELINQLLDYRHNN